MISSAKQLLRNAAVYTISNILNAAIPFILIPILTSILSPSEYGILAMYSASLGILGAFTGLSVQGAVNVRYFDRNKIFFPQYVGSCFCVLLLSTLFTLALACTFSKYLTNFTSLPLFWLAMAVAVSGSDFAIQIRLGIWLMSKKPAHYGTFQVSLGTINLLLSLLFVVTMKQGYEGRLWGQSLAVFLFALFAIISLSYSGWISFQPKWKYIREAISFGLPLIPHVIGGFLIALADRFIVNRLLGLESVGIYMVAVQIAMGLSLLSDAFNKAFVPWLYEQLNNNNQVTKYRIVRGTWVYFCIALILAGLVASLSNKIIFLVAGPRYVAAASALSWLALGQAFSGMYLMVTNYVFFKRKTKNIALITLLSGCLGVLMTWALIPRFGITGAGLSFAFAMFTRFLLTWRLANTLHPMPWFSFRKATLKPPTSLHRPAAN